MCVCVCVCEGGERDRQRQRQTETKSECAVACPPGGRGPVAGAGIARRRRAARPGDSPPASTRDHDNAVLMPTSSEIVTFCLETFIVTTRFNVFSNKPHTTRTRTSLAQNACVSCVPARRLLHLRILIFHKAFLPSLAQRFNFLPTWELRVSEAALTLKNCSELLQ